MQIQNNFISQKVDQTSEVQTTRGSGQQREAAAASTTQTELHVPAPEIQRLVGLVQQEPEVRQGKLDEAAKKLSNGSYLTHDSAVLTAEAILAAPD